MKRNKIIINFNANHIGAGNQVNGISWIGGNHPPKKRITHKQLIRIILAYSPNENKAKLIPEYSTLYPATSSASASGRSKGGLFVSARAEIKNNSANGNNGIINQICSWHITIFVRFNEPTHKITLKIIKPIDTS
jgi:hypothetical protein